MAGEIETLLFGFGRGTQAHRLVDDEVEDRTADTRPQQRDDYSLDLGDHLTADAVGFGVEARREDSVVEVTLTAERRRGA